MRRAFPLFSTRQPKVASVLKGPKLPKPTARKLKRKRAKAARKANR